MIISFSAILPVTPISRPIHTTSLLPESGKITMDTGALLPPPLMIHLQIPFKLNALMIVLPSASGAK